LTPDQQAYVEQLIEERLQAYTAEQLSMQPEPPPPPSLTLRADIYNKLLMQNDQTNGSVTWGNPSPQGDNFSGNNGAASELQLIFNGRVGNDVEAGARVASRWGMQWADFYENGDRVIDPVSGRFGRIDASGQSLGMDHAQYMQLRGIFIRAAPPIPTVRYVHFGSSDLGQFSPFTVGKQRYIDRDNARGIFIDGGYRRYFGYHFARVALPKLYGSAGWNTGVQDPLVENPFWARDAVYVAKLTSEPWRFLRLETIHSFIMDEEADKDDPDALGSDNVVDDKDGVVQTGLRYTNYNGTVSANVLYDWVKVDLLAGVSRSQPNKRFAFNTVEGSQGFSPIPYKEAYGWALIGRGEVLDPLGWSTYLRAEYFNIGPDWVATMGARREADVLLTEGFMEGGQLPTLNIANEFQDFVDPWFESIVGWHGATLQAEWAPGTAQVLGEVTALTYNTNTCWQPWSVTERFIPINTPWQKRMCEDGRNTREVYPTFLYNQGMTDTDFYTFANTNDRGRDPRAVYATAQNRFSIITVLKGAYTIPVMRGVTLRGRGKFILDRDTRNINGRTGTKDAAGREVYFDPRDDDYTGLLFFLRAGVEAPITDNLSVGVGDEVTYWYERHRSGAVVGGVADFPNYHTWKNKLHVEARYVLGAASLWYRLEYLNKDMFTSKPELNQHLHNVLRSIATVSASF
jgi:hypothetical protein